MNAQETRLAPVKVAVLIPARYASTRLPGKPLLRDTGKPLIQHVYEQALKARCAGRVVVATDDERIFRAVRGFDGEVAMTCPDHASGTDRIAEVARDLDADLVVNVQGDEPEIAPRVIDALVETLSGGERAEMSTAVVPLHPGELADPDLVKAVLDQSRYVLYFSRAPIPFDRDGRYPVGTKPIHWRHVGIYCYRREFLLRFASWGCGALEAVEKLEQLRALEHGARIKAVVADCAAPGIDTPQQYDEFVKRHRMKAEAPS